MTTRPAGMAVLMTAHIAGMVDLVALPVWIGSLMQSYGYQPQQAGLTVTLFLAAVALTSSIVSPLFTRLPRRLVAVVGYALAAACFFAMTRLPQGVESLVAMAALHALAGVGVGCGLSMVHGAMGRTANPHRMFAWANGLLGVFAVVFFALVPGAMLDHGGAVVFLVFVGLQAVALVLLALGFPDAAPASSDAPAERSAIPLPAWFAIGAVVFMTLNQAMIFSFIERVGMERGFGAERVGAVLLALGLVNLVPSPLAGLLQKRLAPSAVAMAVPVAQAGLALVIMNAVEFTPYALATSLFVFGALFGHVFLFGLIARLDPSGRATASTPAMMMLGSAIGPALGGAIVQGAGYGGLGVAAVVVGLGMATCALLIRRGTVVVPAAA